jgi:pyruvate formate lyase activating enzyme
MAAIESAERKPPNVDSGDSDDEVTSVRVLNIERHALHDGPGIRTLVFLMGCPLSCLWCSNPEAQSSGPILIYDQGICTACGLCVKACPTGAIAKTERGIVNDRTRCTGCGTCVPVCPVEARSIAGKAMRADEILEVVLRDEVFYRHSSGGVTVSGGEPMLHAEFLGKFFQSCRNRGIHTAVETCGHCEWEDFQRMLPVTDLFLYDVKHIDSEKHKQQTGVGNSRIMENLTLLSRTGNSVIVRVPVIPGFNGSEKELERIIEFVRSLRTIAEIHLLPYHSLGIGKYRKLERQYELSGAQPPDIVKLGKLIEKTASPGRVIRLEI